MPPRIVVHKVGTTAAALGVASVLALSFTTLSPNRLVTPKGLSLVESVGPAWAAFLLAGWASLALASILRGRPQTLSLVRGCISMGLVLGTLALGAVAAARLLPTVGPYARVSMGGGAWVSMIAAYAAVLSARRELREVPLARVFLTAGIPVGIGAMLVSGMLSDLGMLKEYANVSDSFWVYVRNTIVYSAAALLAATLIGFGLGVLAFVARRFEQPIFGTVNVFQTIPGLAMVGLLFAPLAWMRLNVPLAEKLGIGGLGWAPVVIALTLYALLAITRNTYAGLKAVPEAVVEAGRGMGMTPSQIMWQVRIPLALPVLFSGERTAAVQTVGNSVLGAFVAAFTLGTLIFGGLAQQAMDLTMLGSVALVILAVIVDGLLRSVQRRMAKRTHAERPGPATGGGSA